MVITDSELEQAWVVFGLQDDLICKMVRLTVISQVEVTFRDCDLLILIDHDYLQSGLKRGQFWLRDDAILIRIGYLLVSLCKNSWWYQILLWSSFKICLLF